LGTRAGKPGTNNSCPNIIPSYTRASAEKLIECGKTVWNVVPVSTTTGEMSNKDIEKILSGGKFALKAPNGYEGVFLIDFYFSFGEILKDVKTTEVLSWAGGTSTGPGTPMAPEGWFNFFVNFYGNYTKAYNSIKTQVKNASLARLASASNIFGQGFAEKTIKAILEAQPNILTSELTEEEKVMQITAIKGFATKTATQFVKSIGQFNLFIEKIRPNLNEDIKEDGLKEEGIKEVHIKDEDQQSNTLKNKVLVLSDFDKSVYTKKEITNEVIKLGARVEASITKETNILVVGNLLKNTTKIVKAKKNSAIEIVQLDSFLKKYLPHLQV
jgi:thermostable 8-oxoguanine DNA glycosylase